MARVWKGGFALFDTQFINDHLKRFGAYELPFPRYKKELSAALKVKTDFVLRGLEQRQILLEYLAVHNQ